MIRNLSHTCTRTLSLINLYSMNKTIIDSKELAVGAWIRTDGEIARITSLYKQNGELVAEGKLYDDSSDICTDEIMIYPKWMEPIPVTMLLLEKNGWWRTTRLFSRTMFLCSTTFRFHTYTSFRTSCTNTMRISASICRYSRFN